MKSLKGLLTLGTVFLAQIGSAQQSANLPEAVKTQLEKLHPDEKLGARLFFDARLGNGIASCQTCHAPKLTANGVVVWADQLALSPIPGEKKSNATLTRNTPSLLDAVTETSFPSDGKFAKLDDYLSYKLTSPMMGWSQGKDADAKKSILDTLTKDDGKDPLADGTYAATFKTVKNMDIASMSPDDALKAVVASINDFLVTVTTNKASGYDGVMQQNRLPEGLAGEGDTAMLYSGRLFESRIANEEGRVQMRFVANYDETAYQGFKAFFRMAPTWSSSIEGEEKNIGNCIACHTPPRFTDGKFHNVGTSQFEYDALHGDGAFMKLKPAAPSDKTRALADKSDADKADLGRWNIDPKEENFGAFKTPKLRNPDGTAPYMHNGRYKTIEEAIRMHLEAAELAKAGKLRNADPELLKIQGITETDIANIARFFTELNEVPKEKYRDYRISNIRIRQDPKGEATFSN